MISRPTRVHLAASAAEGITPLNAFDNALMKIGLADYNLVKVTSVFPPGARLVDEVDLPEGSLVPCVYTSLTGREKGERIGAAIGLGMPGDPRLPGVVMEFSGRCSAGEAQEETKRMVIDAMYRRHTEKYEMKFAAVEHEVESCGCVVSILLLLP